MEPSSRLIKSHTGSTFPERRITYNQSHHRRSSCLRKRSSLMIRRSPKMKRLGATKRGNDKIEAKERETIGQRKMGIVDQRCRIREETRRGDKNWISSIEENASYQKQKRDILVEQTAIYRR
ncbi:hypothetical protein DY000_02019090 [Brassica cretica]|uniref:Uncharacterized protein n=1 Tax=Brassica cretica TaxID=69181 RepID=A0ABQ7CX60_BRACR|nr:hypothetical protein DY000_02019090 [Brassica cretica]